MADQDKEPFTEDAVETLIRLVTACTVYRVLPAIDGGFVLEPKDKSSIKPAIQIWDDGTTTLIPPKR